MKRDFDLIRLILLEVQKTPAGEQCDEIPSASKYDAVTISEHVRLLIDEGLIDGKMIDSMGSPPEYDITGLTWKGHDFIDAAKNDTLWAKAKKTVLTTTSAITSDILLLWLKTQIKDMLKLP